MTRIGAFDDAGRLIGSITDLPHEHWWGGRRVVSAGVSGVAVRPESRGGGVSRRLLTGLLEHARERGAAISTLYPTVSDVYRAAGWEVAGVLEAADLDTAGLPRTRGGADVRLTPGSAADLPRVTDLYEQVARVHDGLLTRRGGFFDEPPETPLPHGVDAITLAEAGGELTGALLFGRGRGYGPEARLDVSTLLARDAPTARALVEVLAGWRTVTRTVRVPLLAGDAVSTVLPLERAQDRPASRSCTGRSTSSGPSRPAAGRRTCAAASPSGSPTPWRRGTTGPGSWRSATAPAALTRAATEPDLTLDVRGFAVLYCGASTGRAAAQAGLAGGNADPAALDLLGSGPRAQLLDYF